ncbi:MAG TPA: aldolase/citrate lyase family protein [Actinoplanes sp.]|jgi:2-keto-3-deoxy-L-rhamnonate aldolase RhmA|nr:aldolase/citrate lyase family protein [Actinoplanes sp.]
MSAPVYTGLRQRLRHGAPLVGTFITVPRVEILEIAAVSGFDLVVLDLEHGPFGVEALPALIAAGRGAGLAVVVRVAQNSEQAIGAVLDAGADGVLIPHVGDATDAGAAVRAARMPPAGTRSLHAWIRAAHYGADTDYVTTADRGVAVLVMAEGQDAIRDLPGILATPDLDAVFVGPMDLSASLGLTGQPDHPRVTALAGDVLTAAVASGRAGGIFAPTVQRAAAWFAAGARLVVVSVDTDLTRRGFTAARDELDDLTPSIRRPTRRSNVHR